MLEKSAFAILLIFFSAFSYSVFSQENQQSKSRDVLIRESIINLDSNDIRIADQAARYLGIFKVVEAVPKLLKVLKSSRLHSITEHMVVDEKSKHYEWQATNVKETIIYTLGQIGDKRAVSTIKKYLINPPKNHFVYGGNAAYALYLITGKSYKYKDHDGTVKRFQKRDD